MTPGAKIKFTGLFSVLMVAVILLSTVGVSVGKAQDEFPPQLQPELSTDGLTLYNAAPTLVIVADPNPAMQNLKFPAEMELATAMADLDAAKATFSITYIAAGGFDRWGEPCYSWPVAAKTAFNKAAEIWSNIIQSTVPITIRACWASLTGGTLGYSGGAPIHRDFIGAPKANTWYQGALANSLRGSDLSTDSDMNIAYNKNFTWYYGTDGNTPAGQYDLVTVAAHEIAHGLNFSGSGSYSGGNGYWGYSTGYPDIYDTFMESLGGTKVTAYTSGSIALGTLFTSNSLWFDGTYANAANGGTRVKMYAPSTWNGGSSYSHLDYSTFAGTSNSMMVYAVSSGASQHNPGNVTKGIFRDMGWTLVSAAAPTIPTPVAPSGTITDKTPTYEWTKIAGATQYRYQLYKGTSITPVYTKTVTTPVCGTTTCTNTPTNILALAAYKWRVQAYVGGAWKTYSAYKNFSIAAPLVIPTPVAPSGTITDKTPTYKWTKIAGATQYRYQLYKGTSITPVYTKTVTTPVCGTTTCTNTPTNILALATYKWRVQAYVGGAWKAWSAYKNFNVALPTIGFNSQFNGNYTGWVKHPGGVWKISSTAYYNNGAINSKYSSSSYNKNFTNFAYEARILDAEYFFNGLIVRGNPTFNSTDNKWQNGYYFLIDQSGYFGIFNTVNDIWATSPTGGWTSTSTIIKGGWNTIKAEVSGSNLKFYINGQLVFSGSDSKFSSGRVGLVLYRSLTLNRFSADWAKLTPIPASAGSIQEEPFLSGQGDGSSDPLDHFLLP